MTNRVEKIGVSLPTVLLPKEGTDLTKWAVVACDQYTSQPEYWKKVEDMTKGSPSTLKMIFPEVYLEDADCEKRIENINSTMDEYLSENVLVPHKDCFIYVDRKTSHAQSRKGLILAVDLEKYDYNKGSQTLIRATEGTVLDRLPPRIKIRQNAPIELPHIMLLIDDEDRTVIEPVAAKADKLEKLYDFELMMDGGHIKGYKVDNSETVSGIVEALEKLSDKEVFMTKYGVGSDKGVLLFAAGDGNHSLATAKSCWEKLKNTLSEDEINSHPARFALVEVVNVHDEGLEFEPIHRVVFDVNPQHMKSAMLQYFCDNNIEASCKTFASKELMQAEMVNSLKENKGAHVLPFVTKDSFGIVTVFNPKYNLDVGTLQCFLDEYSKSNSQIRVDYIHGEEVVDSLGSKEGNIGFYLPPMNKCDLFKTVILDGVLPKKTFSMGEAEEKRFYLECRKICK